MKVVLTPTGVGCVMGPTATHGVGKQMVPPQSASLWHGLNLSGSGAAGVQSFGPATLRSVYVFGSGWPGTMGAQLTVSHWHCALQA